jgi:WhiB family redox-sensing transcriptional regulator
LTPTAIGSLQAADPITGIRGLLFFPKTSPDRTSSDEDSKRHRSAEEVRNMTISELVRTDWTPGSTTPEATLGQLHDRAERVEDDSLPCRANNPELWFAESPQDVEFAKALCLDCPVRAMCLDGALERREPWGVWGGQLFLQGVVIPRKRPRGRPRKNEAAA